MSQITEDDVKKVSLLSRLNLPENKISTYTGQLERILTYVEQLGEIDTSMVPPTTRAVEVVNVTHEDQVIFEGTREELLDLAPQREGDFFRVGKILDN
uniref:Glutamyl-tRNA(Gln) amidotransferase subunit C, mitochondrial n=1 Tax=Paulinella longichromatophora TaxID=1708747 RepID=A0A2H4ZPS5_9EUKA|nr:glutamyl-tRNA (Gln) amidotransferase subunit C [Paulinella longichromatophora]